MPGSKGAVTEAIRHCARHGILASLLTEHGSEVMNMLLGEWNLDEAKEVWFEEGWEKAEAKYQPVIKENQAIIAEKDLMLTAKDREIPELRQKLQEMGQG